MAGDWIKMGKDLLTHPKVVRMSSALRADRLRTVGGLFAVWCLFDTHSADGQLSGYTPEALDELVGFPGISDAMESVGWLSHNEEGVFLPGFEQHNGQSAKRRAQETDRKREDRKTSASNADKKRTREEKRREEKNSPSLRSGDSAAALSVSDLVAEGVSEQHAQDWLKARKDKGAKTLTPTAWSAVKVEAEKAGMTPAEAVKTAAERQWQGFKADWLHQAARASPSKPPTAAQMAMAQACPTLVAPHLQGYAKQHEPTYVEEIHADARLLD